MKTPELDAVVRALCGPTTIRKGWKEHTLSVAKMTVNHQPFIGLKAADTLYRAAELFVLARRVRKAQSPYSLVINRVMEVVAFSLFEDAHIDHNTLVAKVADVYETTPEAMIIPTESAIGWLMEHGVIERDGEGRYQLTPLALVAP